MPKKPGGVRKAGEGLQALGKLSGNPVISLMGSALANPQWRLSSREQQPRPPKPKGAKRR
jgi:hypothetical protein